MYITRQLRKVGKERDEQKRRSVDEANKTEPQESVDLFSGNLGVGLVHVGPDLS
jgi:hypothetical protein